MPTLEAARRRFDPIAGPLGRRNPLLSASGGGFDFHADGPAWEDSWLADDLSAVGDGNAVSDWTSGSGGLSVLSQSTGTKQPLYRATGGANGQPGVQGDKTDDALFNSSLGSTRPFTWVVVWTGFTGISLLVTMEQNNPYYTLGSSVANGGNWRWYVASDIDTGVAIDANPHMMVGYVSASDAFVEIDGARTTRGTGDSRDPGQFHVLGRDGVGGWTDATISFVGKYAGDATADANWATWVAAAETKWGLTIA